MDTPAADAPAEPAAQRSLPRRVPDTFVSPGALFAGFGERPPWVGVLLVSTVVLIAVFALVPQELYVAMMREQIQRQGNPRAAAGAESMVGFAQVFGIVGAAISPWITALVVALLLLLVFRWLMSGEATFRQYLGVSAHASLIPALGALITLPLQIARGDFQTRLSLALLAPGLDPESVLYRILHAIDVFSLWWLAIIALGVATLNRRIGWGGAAAIIFGVYLVVIVGAAVLRPG